MPAISSNRIRQFRDVLRRARLQCGKSQHKEEALGSAMYLEGLIVAAEILGIKSENSQEKQFAEGGRE